MTDGSIAIVLIPEKRSGPALRYTLEALILLEHDRFMITMTSFARIESCRRSLYSLDSLPITDLAFRTCAC